MNLGVIRAAWKGFNGAGNVRPKTKARPEGRGNRNKKKKEESEDMRVIVVANFGAEHLLADACNATEFRDMAQYILHQTQKIFSTGKIFSFGWGGGVGGWGMGVGGR